MPSVRICFFVCFFNTATIANIHNTTLALKKGKVLHLTRCAPFQSTTAPEIDKTCYQDRDKNKDLDKPYPACFTDRNCPGKEEDYFQIENDEEDSVR